MAGSVTRMVPATVLILIAPLLGATGGSQAGRGAAPAQAETRRALIAAAIKEGSLNYWDTVIQSKTNAALVAAFKAQHGLPSNFTVNYSLIQGVDLITRAEQEISTRRISIDVGSVAALPWVHDKVRAGQIMRYDSPEYPQYRAAFAKGLGKDGYFAFNGAYMFVPMWNADRFDFKGTSWKDVAAAVAAGRMSMGDVGKSQTYLSTYIGLKQVLSADDFKKLAAMRPVYLVRSEQIASQLVTGQNLLAFSGMPSRAFQFNARGAKLKFLIPKEGIVLLPQAMFILAGAPHPAAAKLWIDFVLSEAGQKIVVENEALISGRSGFVSSLPAFAPSIDSLKILPLDWEKTSQADMERARAEWLAIFNR